jgi:hypothetical protein
MEQIEYEQYINALSIVKRFQDQILSDDDKVEAKLRNSYGTILLRDFLAKNVTSQKTMNALRGLVYFNTGDNRGIDFNECTVEYFLYRFIEDVERAGRIKIIRGIGQSAIIELLSIFENKGFDVEEFKYYYQSNSTIYKYKDYPEK